MAHALLDVVGSLPDATRVYCGHEYSVSNLDFAVAVEPHNADTVGRSRWAKALTDAGTPTVPSTGQHALL